MPPFPIDSHQGLDHVLPNGFFCEQARGRTAAAFELWLFLSGSEGVGTDTVCHCAIGAIFELCKDFFRTCS